MKKVLSLIMVLALLMGVFTGCAGKSNAGDKKGEPKKTSVDAHSVDLQGNYTVKDPKDVKYDTRSVIYKPNIAGDEIFEKGGKVSYVVIYSLDKKGKHMFNVQAFDTKEHAAAYQKEQGKGTVDGKNVIVESDETFFVKMESFMPTANDFVNNMKQSGYMDLK